MKILVLNGSPRKSGTVATLLRDVADGAVARGNEVEWIDAHALKVAPCTACMRCRSTGTCSLPEDDGHRVGRSIREAGALVVGTPVHWANLSTPLKVLFDRNVPVFMGETPSGLPRPMQKGKSAVIVTACNTPPLFDWMAGESRGAIRAVREVLHYGGYHVLGTVVNAGTRASPEVPARLRRKARRLGDRFRP